MTIHTSPAERTAPQASTPAAPVLTRLGRLADIGEDGVAVVGQLQARRTWEAGAELAAARQAHPPTLLVISGWSAWVRTLGDGRRQIFSLVLPGETLGLGAMPCTGCGCIALTRTQTVDASALREQLRFGPDNLAGLARALQLSAALHHSTLLNQILRLGRLSAYERICHLLLEVRERLAAADPTPQRRFQLPLTQDMLGDALGLSTVHVNRVLQQVRRDGLVEMRGGQAMLRDAPAMARLCGYQPLLA